MLLPLLMIWPRLVKFVMHHIAFGFVYALNVICVVGHPFNIEQPCKMSDRDTLKAHFSISHEHQVYIKPVGRGDPILARIPAPVHDHQAFCCIHVLLTR